MRNKDRVWSNRPERMQSIVPDFVQPAFKPVPADCQKPFDFFKLLVNDDFVDLTVEKSQAYAAKMNKHADVPKISHDSIRVSQAVMFITGYSTPANRKMFWEKRKDGRNQLVAENITRDDFISITQNTYFVNRDEPNPQDKFWKVRPLFDKLNSTGKQLVVQPENVSVDEGMIGYYGPHPLKQFMRGKPTRFGFKVWILATSDGQLLGCQPYAGGSTCIKNYGLGQGPDVVYGLAEQYGLVPGTKIFCDNLFTSLDLLDHMGDKGVGVTGTMRVNRLFDIPLPNKNRARKELQRGEFKATYTDHSTVVVWKDNQPVYMASNFEGPEPVGQASRYSGKDKKYIGVAQPHLNQSYNKYMGGVDLLDNGEKNYAITTRIRKWWWCIYAWFLNICMVQAWRLFRAHMKHRASMYQEQVNEENKEWEEKMEESGRPRLEIRALRKKRLEGQRVKKQEWKQLEQVALLEFTRQVVEEIMEQHGSSRKSVTPRRSRSLLQTIRFDNIGHLIKVSDPIITGRCAFCYKRSTFRCVRCNVALHPSDCFYLYHTDQSSQ